MMTLIPAQSTQLAEIGNLSTQSLRDELARALTLSAQTLQRLAIIWKELETRGEDLSDLRSGLSAYLPLIAAGQLDAEVVVRFAGNKTLLASISHLPLAEQHRLAIGGSVDIIAPGTDGGHTVRQVPAYALTATQARLVFDAGRVRHPDEQLSIIDTFGLRQRQKTPPRTIATPFVVDRKTNTLKIGRTRITAGQALAAVAELSMSNDDDSVDREKAVVVKLSDVEHRALKIKSAEAGVSAERLMRLALKNAGLID